MEPRHFDALLRRVAGATTRRAALATLLGGGVLLHEHAASEANQQAKRRKRRNRKRRRRNKTQSGGIVKGISFIIDNTAGTRRIRAEAGEVHSNRCCNMLAIWPEIPVGESRLFDTSAAQAYAWIDDHYWIEFDNPLIGRPDISFAQDGMMGGSSCCKKQGQTRLSREPISEGETINVTLNASTFSIHRLGDKSDFKYFNLKLPPVL
ncbi:MAG: hypothetical protein KC442_16315 [Thermomicrobiales bacterium]|nr:hypothetical protein [Thermomicrobiales bacterium]